MSTGRLSQRPGQPIARGMPRETHTEAPPRPPDAPPESQPPAPPSWLAQLQGAPPSPADSLPPANLMVLARITSETNLILRRMETMVDSLCRYMQRLPPPPPKAIRRPLTELAVAEDWPSQDDQTPYRRSK